LKARVLPFILFTFVLISLPINPALIGPAQAQGTVIPIEPLLEEYELRVGLVLPLTGALASYGFSSSQAARLATDEINAAGGILGAKIKLVIVDSESDPQFAVSATESLITEDNVHVLVGYSTSSATMAAMPIAERYKTPVLSIGSSAKELTEQGWRYLFKMAPNATMFSLVTDAFFKDELEPKLNLRRPLRVAALRENTLMGVSNTEEFVKVVGTGREIVAVETYPVGTTDFSALLVKLKALAPDVVFLQGYFTDMLVIAKQSKALGFNPIWITWMFTPGFLELAGENIAYWLVVTEYWYDRRYPSVEANLKVGERFVERFGYPPDFQSWSAYAGMYMLKQVIENAAKNNPDKVKEAFAKDDVGAIREMIREGLATMKLYLDWTGELYFYSNGQLAWSIHGPEMGLTVLQVQPATPKDLWSAQGLTFRTVYSPVYKSADTIIPSATGTVTQTATVTVTVTLTVTKTTTLAPGAPYTTTVTQPVVITETRTITQPTVITETSFTVVTITQPTVITAPVTTTIRETETRTVTATNPTYVTETVTEALTTVTSTKTVSAFSELPVALVASLSMFFAALVAAFFIARRS
jgi:branched-chain amino acid transport system substrate-binding protein